jgi:hypothetical protein
MYDRNLGHLHKSHWESILVKAVLQLHMDIWQAQKRHVIVYMRNS